MAKKQTERVAAACQAASGPPAAATGSKGGVPQQAAPGRGGRTGRGCGMLQWG